MSKCPDCDRELKARNHDQQGGRCENCRHAKAEAMKELAQHSENGLPRERKEKDA